MRVLVIHCAYQYKGGEDSVVDAEVRLLRSNGVTVELLLFSNSGNVAVKMLQLPFNTRSYGATKRKIRAFKPDIVHIHNLHFAGTLAVFHAVKSSGIPFVSTLHNYRLVCPSGILFNKGEAFTASLRQEFPWSAVSKAVYRDSAWQTFWVALSTWLHRKLGTLQQCSRYIVLSDHAKEIFLASGMRVREDRFVVKQNFCDSPAVGIQAEKDYFLYVGRLSAEKGIGTLLEAMSRCDYKIKIIGDGPLRASVERSAAQFSHIEYAGPLQKNEVFALLKECTALIFPSVWPEGMPMTIIEAFSHGIPVIASRTGVMETMIGDAYNGLHFQPGDGDDLLVKLHQWRSLDASKRDIFRRNALNTFHKQYTAERNFQKLLSIYDGVLNQTNREIKKVSNEKDQLIEYSHPYGQL